MRDPGAVGQQIRKLEDWLGVALFVREVRQVLPTEAARAYWQRIQPALAEIADASRKVRDSGSMAVWLSMPPGFAAKWFTSRMAGLLTRYPGLELHLNASAQLVDFERDAIDLAIRYFDGRAPQLDVTLLCTDEARVYCTRPMPPGSLCATRTTCTAPRCWSPPCSLSGNAGSANSATWSPLPWPPWRVSTSIRH